ncbi:MAG: MmgE/PrpD family protein [Betaproteobacteria bacterium]|nr:MmgE/PrpD family protein [Betaproteobacteria bacterium]
MDTPAAHLMRFALSLEAQAIPRDVLARARWCLLDGLGCGLFGAGQPWSRIMFDEMSAERSQGPCMVFGQRRTLPAAPAAMCNGTAIHGFELDDVIAAALVHPGTVIIPAVVAAAESVDASGANLLRGVVVGYEAMSRLSLALGTGPSERGFHKTSVVGPVAAAIAAGAVMRLPYDQLACAVGLACSTGSGVKSFAAGHGGGMVKRMHAGRAAEAGVRVAQLARRGFTGPASAIDGRMGLLEAFSGGSAAPEQLRRALGEEWALRDVWIKVFPTCGWIQGPAQLLLNLRGAQPLPTHRIKKVVIGTSAFAVKHNGNPSPSDTMEAQYSLPYCAALTLTGNPRDPEAYSLDAIRNPVLHDLARRVELKVDPESEAAYPRRVGSRVQLHLDNGEVRESATLDPHGSPADPCTDDEVIAKFNTLAARAPLPCDAAAIVRAIRSLETFESGRRFTALLRA